MVFPVVVVACALAVLASPAAAQGDEEPPEALTSVTATLNYDVGEGPDAVETPAEGVEFTVTEGDDEVGTAETDADGVFFLEVPGPGTYTVGLDPGTLPDGVELRDPDTTSRTVAVNPREQRRVLFPIQEEGAAPPSSGAGSDSGSEWERFLRLSVEGVKFGLALAMMAIGLSLIFGTTGLTNFAHGEVVVGGTVIAWYLNTNGLWLPIAAVLAMVIMFFLGSGLDAGLWRPLRGRGTSLVSMLVITIGLSLFLRYLTLYIFGGSPRSFDDYALQTPYEWGPITIVPKDLWSIAISVVVLTAVGLVLVRTRVGKAIRAVADNRELARSSGINVDQVIRVVWGAGAALATLGGVMFATGELVTWDFGFKLLLLLFAGTILGGLGTAFGAFVGSLLVGWLVQVSTIWISPELKNVSALAVLVVILVIRPQGLFGQRERIG